MFFYMFYTQEANLAEEVEDSLLRVYYWTVTASMFQSEPCLLGMYHVYMLNLNPLWSAILADHSGIRFSL